MVAAQQAEKVAADAFAAAQQNVAKLTGERDAQAKAVATLESAVPMLQQAVEKGAAAAAQLPEDKELAAAAAQLKAALDKTNKDLADSKAKVTDMTAGITTAQAAMKPLEQKMAESKQLVVAATQKIQAEQAAAKPLQDKAAQAKQVFEQASASLDKLRQEVDGLRQQASTTSTAQNAGLVIRTRGQRGCNSLAIGCWAHSGGAVAWLAAACATTACSNQVCCLKCSLHFLLSIYRSESNFPVSRSLAKTDSGASTSGTCRDCDQSAGDRWQRFVYDRNGLW